jgi:hypothetical protein
MPDFADEDGEEHDRRFEYDGSRGYCLHSLSFPPFPISTSLAIDVYLSLPLMSILLCRSILVVRRLLLIVEDGV